jgi:hypothetical protein
MLDRKLNQVIAVEKEIKNRTCSVVTDMYKTAQKPDLFNGFTRVYHPKDEEGEVLPSESKRVQHTVSDHIRKLQNQLVELFNITAAKDVANCSAIADIVVDGVTIMPSVPATYLLFLEKQMNDIRTFIEVLPGLDPSDKWTKDANDALYYSDEVRSVRTKKVPKAVVLYDATKEHPAQVQLIHEDVEVGQWYNKKCSGGINDVDKVALLEKVNKLSQAIKYAREKANENAAPASIAGESIFGYLFGK